jgi:hypothetical protein
MFAAPVALNAVFRIAALAQYFAFTTPRALKLFCAGDKFKPGLSRAAIYSLKMKVH